MGDHKADAFHTYFLTSLYKYNSVYIYRCGLVVYYGVLDHNIIVVFSIVVSGKIYSPMGFNGKCSASRMLWIAHEVSCPGKPYYYVGVV